MKIIGLLSWYDESPSWLAAAVASFAPILDTLVAVDGAYALYPGSKGRSNPIQAETIMNTCDALNIGLTMHRPEDRWIGNEVEKRRFMFELAAPHAKTGTDWFVVIDGDCVLTSYPGDLKEELANTDCHAAECTLWENRDHLDDTPMVARQLDLPRQSGHSHRMLFRSLEQMRVVGAHYNYGGTHNGEWVWAWAPHRMGPTPALMLPHMQVEHRSIWRDVNRRENAKAYYEKRDHLKIEQLYSVDQNGERYIDAT